VLPEQVQARNDGALAGGGRIVSNTHTHRLVNSRRPEGPDTDFVIWG